MNYTCTRMTIFNVKNVCDTKVRSLSSWLMLFFDNIIGCGKRVPADLVFALPPEIKADDTKQALRFIRDLVQEFDIADDSVRLGMVPKQCASVAGFSLTSAANKEDILDMFTLDNNHTRYDTASVLNYMHTQSFQNTASPKRAKAKRIGVIIIDSDSKNATVTALEALSAKDEADIELFVVTVGKQVSDHEARLIASEPEDQHIFSASSYADLVSVAELLEKRINDVCDGRYTA